MLSFLLFTSGSVSLPITSNIASIIILLVATLEMEAESPFETSAESKNQEKEI
jgi:hypothetical protein